MDKKLPGVFVNKIDKELHNNERVYVASNDVGSQNLQEETEETRKVSGDSIYDKIRNIFAGKNYIYKAEVLISFADHEERKRIVGKSGNYLLTYDNEKILIDDILDIQVIEKST